MANFKIVFPRILDHEGGFRITPAGEVVNRGINTNTLLAVGYTGTKEELTEIVRNLTVEETEDIYYKFYWTFPRPSITNALDLVESQTVANKIVDMAILSGVITAIKLVQTAVGVTADGFFGKNTLKKVNEVDPDELVSKLIKVWKIYLNNRADKKIEAANMVLKYREQQLEADPKHAQEAVEEAKELIAYWERVRIGWMIRSDWNGVV